jgi:prephenate dehydrogenase
VWSAIALDNGHEIEMALEAVEAQLRALRLSIRERDRECVSAQLSKAREWASGM